LTFTARAAGPPTGRPVILLHGFPQTSWSWRRPTIRAPFLCASCSGYACGPATRGFQDGL
jgi:pimeloyl-ACP methyl ester carboxylesterase